MTPMSAYPVELEAWWLRAAEEETGLKGRAALQALEGEVARLSDGFTVARQGFDYRQSRRAWIAYGLFYFPQTYARLRLTLDEVLERGWTPPSPLRVLDLGAGAGAASWAARGGVAGPIEALLVDSSPEALSLAAMLAEQMPAARCQTLCGDVRRPPPGAWDLIVVSYALNEAFAGAGEAPLTAWLEEAAGRLTADGLLIVCEPAETEPGRMAWLRQRAAGLENIHIWSPCLHRGACPLAGRGEGCHDVRRRPAPESVRLLNRRLHRDVVNLKFSSLVVGKRPVGVAVGPEQFRLVAPVRWLKGKWAMTGCAGDGQLRCYEVLQRALSSEQKRGMDRLERGQVLELTEVQARGPVWRGRPRRMT